MGPDPLPLDRALKSHLPLRHPLRENFYTMPAKNHEAIAQKLHGLIGNVQKAIVGKRRVILESVAALISDGHVLLEDVPGVGKTLLAKAIARSVAGEFRRIQFTADLLPSDITGLNVYQQQSGEFLFQEGPIFANVLLADEINRATPRTQSSLLEAMEEGQVTIDGERHILQPPFFVIATQNPIELEGTYPLPFSQMDRFMIRLSIGYLEAAEEEEMLRRQRLEDPLIDLEPVLDTVELRKIQRRVRETKIADDLVSYVVQIVRATRGAEALEFGASPRGSLDLMRYAQALALIDGRDYVLPDDVKSSAPIVLQHRVIQKKGSRFATVSGGFLVEELVEQVKVPV